MTRSEIHRTSAPATETVPPPGSGRARTLLSSRAGAVLLPTLLLVVAAFGFRSIGLTTSFELWVDEMLYAELGASVARGELPNLPDGPFFLHPPGFFIVEAIAIHLFGISGDRMDLVYQLRWVSAFCGALSVGLIFVILRRPIGAPAAFVAGLLAVFEPFILRNNSRVFIETTGMLAVLVGLALVVDHLCRDADQRSRLRLVVAGLALGYGLLTKDVLFVCTVVPVALAVLWRRTLPLRDGGAADGDDRRAVRDLPDRAGVLRRPRRLVRGQEPGPAACARLRPGDRLQRPELTEPDRPGPRPAGLLRHELRAAARVPVGGRRRGTERLARRGGSSVWSR